MKRTWHVAPVGFWLTVGLSAWDLWHHTSVAFDITWLSLWIVLIKLNEIGDLLETNVRRPYLAPALRSLQWADLTPKQQKWIDEQRASPAPKRP